MARMQFDTQISLKFPNGCISTTLLYENPLIRTVSLYSNPESSADSLESRWFAEPVFQFVLESPPKQYESVANRLNPRIRLWINDYNEIIIPATFLSEEVAEAVAAKLAYQKSTKIMADQIKSLRVDITSLCLTYGIEKRYIEGKITEGFRDSLFHMKFPISSDEIVVFKGAALRTLFQVHIKYRLIGVEEEVISPPVRDVSLYHMAVLTGLIGKEESGFITLEQFNRFKTIAMALLLGNETDDFLEALDRADLESTLNDILNGPYWKDLPDDDITPDESASASGESSFSFLEGKPTAHAKKLPTVKPGSVRTLQFISIADLKLSIDYNRHEIRRLGRATGSPLIMDAQNISHSAAPIQENSRVRMDSIQIGNFCIRASQDFLIFESLDSQTKEPTEMMKCSREGWVESPVSFNAKNLYAGNSVNIGSKDSNFSFNIDDNGSRLFLKQRHICENETESKDMYLIKFCRIDHDLIKIYNNPDLVSYDRYFYVNRNTDSNQFGTWQGENKP